MSLSVNELKELIGASAKVRVWHNWSQADAAPDFEGELIGLYDHPSIIIRDGDGKQSTHSSQLRIEVVPLPWEPPSGSAVAANDSVWLRCAKGWFDGFQSGNDIELLTWAQLHARYEVRPLVYDPADTAADLPWEGKDWHGVPVRVQRNGALIRVGRAGTFADLSLTDAAEGAAAVLRAVREARHR